MNFILATYTNASQNDWYLSKYKRALRSIYRTPINQFPRLVQFSTRL